MLVCVSHQNGFNKSIPYIEAVRSGKVSEFVLLFPGLWGTIKLEWQRKNCSDQEDQCRSGKEGEPNAGEKLPVSIDDFGKLRKEGFYYIDKTGLIRDLLNNWGKVNLFTRPRRFGKTLNMSMLKNFFEIGADTALFDDLEISKEKSLCETYMGKFRWCSYHSRV